MYSPRKGDSLPEGFGKGKGESKGNADKGKGGKDTLEEQLANSHLALRSLHKKLKVVAAQDDSKVGHRDQLTRRFLGTFWRYMQQENPDVKAKP